jgi:hypothetical protein
MVLGFPASANKISTVADQFLQWNKKFPRQEFCTEGLLFHITLMAEPPCKGVTDADLSQVSGSHYLPGESFFFQTLTRNKVAVVQTNNPSIELIPVWCVQPTNCSVLSSQC